MTWFSHALSPIQRDGLLALATLFAVAVLALVAQRVVVLVLERVARRKSDGVLAAVVRRARPPSRFIFPLVAVEGALPFVSLPAWSKLPSEQVLGGCIVAAIAWGVIALVELAADLAKRRYRLDDEDNLRARQVETRLDIMSRTLSTLVVLIAVAAIAMTFPPIRAVGATLLASAGLAGIVAGLAARPILENLVAGVQIAFTQPIRIDDVVIVESEYGHIEKITATYVVVKLWDWRRMVLPLTYFIDHPFQNWTYDRAELIGSVFVYLDYAVDVEDVRAEVGRVVESARLWDGKVVNVAMTDAKESTVELRILVSARNSPELFDLRCLVRERVIAYVATKHPDRLPATRVALSREAALA